MGSLEAAEFSTVNEDPPEQTILQVMLGTGARKEESQHLFLPGKSKQENTRPEIAAIRTVIAKDKTCIAAINYKSLPQSWLILL